MWPSFIVSIADPIMLKRERTRTWLAYGITGLVGVVALILIAWGIAVRAPLSSVLTGVFTPLIGIAGIIIGFYFAGEKTK